jgi:glycosyltransferase involved in cell wall biosynthesis
MAGGRAVVATDAGEIPRLVEDGKTGFIVPRNDSSALVERMKRLMTDGGICRRMGKAGRAKIEREFGLARLVEETLAVYRSAGWRDIEAL